MSKRAVRVGLASLVIVGSVLAAPAAADVTTPPGRCVGSASFAKGGDGPFSVSSKDLSPSDVTTVPLSDTVSWEGSLIGVPAGTSREISGYVKVDMPWPIPDVTIDDWGGSSSRVANKDVKEYSLPSVTPRGVELRVYGQHSEAGQVFCSGSTKIKINGGAFSSPFALISLALLVASAALLAFTGMAVRPVLGAVAGFLTMLFLASTLLFLGVLPLNSVVVSVLPVLGIPLGAVWGKLAPLMRHVAPAV